MVTQRLEFHQLELEERMAMGRTARYGYGNEPCTHIERDALRALLESHIPWSALIILSRGGDLSVVVGLSYQLNFCAIALGRYLQRVLHIY